MRQASTAICNVSRLGCWAALELRLVITELKERAPPPKACLGFRRCIRLSVFIQLNRPINDFFQQPTART